MRQLQRLKRVKTSYGGRFVESINGLSGGSSGGSSFDWFFFVNGVESAVGAAEVTLTEGDDIWWDHRDWSAASHVPAVVGAWPHPFSAGPSGKRLPTRLLCSPTAATACARVEAALAAEGIVATRGKLGTEGKSKGPMIVVGTWGEIRTDPAARLLLGGPDESGVYVQPTRSGSTFNVLNPKGSLAAAYSAGTGLVAATVVGGASPTWLVTGTDTKGLNLASGALNLRSLTRHFAVVVTDGGRVLSAPMLAGKR
ncbi:MAG: DUF4430 domain-containing protein [Solirubrobacterales bacterium]|nr:DUF4430 domain-containing protein [Solirubrobacterales bacterium]